MQVLPKPIVSPSRADKFPPPLLWFLRSNGGSRSRGRSRSSPIFIRKKSDTITPTETLEPSSPKVTCMGQVRVRKSKQKHISNPRSNKKSRCRWIRKAMLWNYFNRKSNEPPKPSQPYWGRWFVCFQMGFRRTKQSNKTEETEEEKEIEQEEDEKEGKIFVSSSTPPKNALLLMRCRSEPYRASSLANRFWGSPAATEETEQQNRGGEETEQKNREEIEKQDNPTSEKEAICRDSATESIKSSETEEKFGFCEGLESSCCSKEDGESLNTSSNRPMKLTRCKSLPARRSEKLDLETCFWKDKRLGFSLTSQPHVFD